MKTQTKKATRSAAPKSSGKKGKVAPPARSKSSKSSTPVTPVKALQPLKAVPSPVMKKAARRAAAAPAALVAATHTRVSNVSVKAAQQAGWALQAPVPFEEKQTPVKAQKGAAPARTRVAASQVILDDSTLPAALQTGQGRTWTKRVRAAGWTAENMPARDFALMASAISRRAVEALLDMTWSAIAALRGFNPDAKKTVRAGASEIAEVSAGTLRTSRTGARTAAAEPARYFARNGGVVSAAVAAQKQSLTDDAHLAVEICTLPVGTRFKFPDYPREGFKGSTGILHRVNSGSVTVGGCKHGDCIAAGTMVVPLTQQHADEVSA